jgi:hypothetical protein
MKKRCTPENNAMHIHTHVECPAPIVPIVDGCLDPFTYTWNAAVNQALLDPTLSVAEHFDLLLDRGQVLSSAANICCPDCTINPIYVLSSAETFFKLAEALGWTEEPDLTCCINIQASIETYLKYNEAWQIEQYPCCNNDFESCLSQFSTIADLSGILDAGVVETNGYNGNTLLCIIYDLFVNTPEDLLQGLTISEVFDRILDKGFVAYCCDCNVVIASVETFLKWWEATNGCGTVTPPTPGG